MTARLLLTSSLRILAIAASSFASHAFADPDLPRALKRAQYLLNNTVPSQEHLAAHAVTQDSYRAAVRSFLDDDNFYDAMIRYHERLFGTGLQREFLDELLKDDIDNKSNKFAKITCTHDRSDSRFRCYWSSRDEKGTSVGCAKSEEQAASVFWYPGVVAWVCPTVARTCGQDLSRCFVQNRDQNAALNSELGATEIFDSRFSVVKSLAKQSAGIASAVVVANYPYTKILEPGLTAVDGAVSHFYRQGHHFDLNKLNMPPEWTALLSSISLTDTRFRLVFTGNTEQHAGILTTFGWLRRYEKNRTRANQLYERLLCRKFTSSPPRVFPADPGNLRTTEPCNGCHATLDPLADFFHMWGEGGDLYRGLLDPVDSTFGGQSGSKISDLANIIRNDNAFGTCQVENAWSFLMGRKFYRDEADLRQALTAYFLQSNYSFKELLYAIATHPSFLNHARGDALVGDPLEEPPLGEPPGGNTDLACNDTIDYATDIAPRATQCTVCHSADSSSRQNLTTEAQWRIWGRQAVNMMASGNMPPGQAGPPQIGKVFELKEAVRCWLEQQP